MNPSRFLPRVFSLLAAAVSTVCGGGDKSPSAVTPTTTLPPPVAPSPTPSPTPVATSCSRLGTVSGAGDCERTSESFLAQVDEALAQLVREQPQIFDLRDSVASGSFRVRSIGQYYVGMIENLEKVGLCADFDGEELQVKNSNDFSDQYHILTSDRYSRRGANSYRATCRPAAFPTPLPPLALTPGCDLPPSKEKACDPEAPRFLKDVDEAIEAVATEHPEYFDLSDRRNGNWYRIVNGDAYVRAMEEALRKKGLCARYDGEEMAVKSENRVSEQFDIYLSEGYTRRGSGSYRTTCYPAAF